MTNAFTQISKLVSIYKLCIGGRPRGFYDIYYCWCNIPRYRNETNTRPFVLVIREFRIMNKILLMDLRTVLFCCFECALFKQIALLQFMELVYQMRWLVNATSTKDTLLSNFFKCIYFYAQINKLAIRDASEFEI